jgi:hypothetical protein
MSDLAFRHNPGASHIARSSGLQGDPKLGPSAFLNQEIIPRTSPFQASLILCTNRIQLTHALVSSSLSYLDDDGAVGCAAGGGGDFAGDFVGGSGGAA